MLSASPVFHLDSVYVILTNYAAGLPLLPPWPLLVLLREAHHRQLPAFLLIHKAYGLPVSARVRFRAGRLHIGPQTSPFLDAIGSGGLCWLGPKGCGHSYYGTVLTGKGL